MPARFFYVALSEGGERVEGTLKCQDRREAIRQVLGRGLHPLDVESAQQGLVGMRVSRETLRRVTMTQLAVFTRQLASVLKAGLPMVQAISTVRTQTESRRLHRILQEVEDSIRQEGGTLADALDDYPRVFSPVYRGVVRAGEEGGNLVEVLDQLAKHLSRAAKLRGQVISAFVYPVFLLVMGTLAIFILMTFVIPRFREMFAGFGQALPLPTEILILISTFMASWWWAILAAMTGCVLLLIAALRKRGIRRRFDALALRLPLLGNMLLRLELSRVAQALGALLNSGVRILEALRVAGDTVGNLAVREVFPNIIKSISTGETLASACQQARLLPPLMVNLIRTGEDTGQLPEMLSQLADIYEEEAERTVTAVVRLLEPILIIVLGAIIATIVAAVMLPVFRASSMVT